MKKYNLLIIMTLILSLLYLTNIGKYIKMIGYCSIFLLVMLLLIIVLSKKNIKIDMIFLSGLLIIIYNFIILIMNFSSKAFYLVFEENILIMFFLLFSQIKYDKETISKISSFFSKVYYFLLIIILFLFFIGNKDIVSMTIYKSIFVLSFFSNIKAKNSFIFTIISFILFMYIGERTCAILFLIIYFLYIIFKNGISFGKFKLIFVIIIIISLLIPHLYVDLQKKPISEKLNEISLKISGERFFSGRNRIWVVVFDKLEGNELFGLSYNNNLLLDNSISLSTHNLFVWLEMNGGYCLIALFVLFLYQIWKKLYSKKCDKYMCLVYCYFISFLILTSFELLWLSNNFVVSIYLWFVVAMGIIYRSTFDSNKKEE